MARALRILVAVGLTAFLLWQSDPAAILSAGRHAHLRFIAAACALVFVDRALMAYRWLTLLSPLDPAHRPRFSVLLRVFLISTFLGTFLPASVGGDALRAYGLSRQGVGGADAIASVLMDRLLGVMSILLVAAGGTVLARGLIDVRLVIPALALLSVACALAIAVVFSPRLAAVLGALIARLPRGQEPAHRLVAAIQRYSSFHAELANVLVCSIAVQVLRVLQTYYLGLALGLTLPLTVYFALVPIILLIVLMPITISGVGTAQAGFVWLFGRAGIPNAQSFALSVLFLAIAVVGNLPGGILYVLGDRPRSED